MDDFDNGYEEEQEEEYVDEGSSSRSSKSLRERKEDIDNAKEKYNKAKEKYQNRQSGTSNQRNLNGNQKEGLKKFGDNIGKKPASSATNAGQAAAKKGAKDASTKAVEKGAKDVGKKVVEKSAKDVGKKVVAKGATAAAGAATGGVAVAAEAALEAAQKIQEKVEAKIKEKYGVDLKEERKKSRRMTLLIICGIVLTIFLLPLLFMAQDMETSVGDLESLVKDREAEYNANIIRFSDGEIHDLLKKDIDLTTKIDPTTNKGQKSYCYKSILKDQYDGELSGFLMSTDSETENEDEFEISVKNVDIMLKAESDNFNKTNWTQVTGMNTYHNTKKVYEIQNGVATGNNVDLSFTSGSGTRRTIDGFDTENAKHLNNNGGKVTTRLKIPKFSKYEIDPGNSDEISKANVYIDMISPYVQKWIVPYSMLINTQDKSFVVDKIMGKMYSKIDVDLFGINRDTKTTTTEYYLQCEKYYSWKEVTKEKETVVEYYIDLNRLSSDWNNLYTREELISILNGGFITNFDTDDSIKNARRTDTSKGREKVTSENVISNSESLDYNTNSKTLTNTRDNPTVVNLVNTYPNSISNRADVNKGERKNTDNSKKVEGNRYIYKTVTTTSTVVEYKDTTEHRDIKRGSNGKPIIAKNPDGTDMISDKFIERDIKVHKYIPKFTYIEDMYRIIKASYGIVPVDETDVPLSKEVSEITEHALQTSRDTAYIEVVECWDETFMTLGSEEHKYKVSYMDEDDYITNGVDISRIEWLQDWGDYNNTDPSREFYEMYPAKTTEQKKEAYDNYANGKGYSYNDLAFAFEKIEEYYGSTDYSSAISGVDLSNIPKDGFAWPVEITAENPGTKVVNCLFGYTPAYGTDHRGVDLSRGNVNYKEGALTKGPKIIAAHDGTVTGVSFTPTADSNGYTYVNIQTDDGSYLTQYGHLSEIYVKKGDKVTRGQYIGRMGTTGNSTGVHLHYVIKDSGGNLLDPLDYYNLQPDYGSIPKESITRIPSGYEYVSSKSAGLSNAGNIETGSDVNSSTYKAAYKYVDYAKKWGAYYGVDPGLIIAMIAQESGGRVTSENNYSIGLMQWEHKANGTSLTTTKADGSSETITGITKESLRNNPDFQIRVGTAEFKSKLISFRNNELVALQGYNYGSAGIKRCITYHLSAGANSDQTYCGISNDQYWAYVQSGDTAWLSAREWYSSTGHKKFGGAGGGDKHYLEHVLRYYKAI